MPLYTAPVMADDQLHNIRTIIAQYHVPDLNETVETQLSVVETRHVNSTVVEFVTATPGARCAGVGVGRAWV